MRNWLTLVLRLTLGAIFIWASWSKILDAASLAETMARYQFLPPALILPGAYFLPWLEMLCGLGLILGVGLRGAAIWANLLLLVFIAVLSYNLVRGLDVDCGCFGSGGGGTQKALLRDLLLLPLSLAVLWTVWLRGRRRRDTFLSYR
ncbi:MAG: DoxX family membrane protein [Deltaproteobacteria bacterium]|nr:DoxX family membrane protein [Deltaproteobacteria bacterium]